MKNYFVERDATKKITGLFARPQYDGQEFLPETTKELVDHFKKQKNVDENQRANNEKIEKEMRQLAIASLKKKKELPANYKEA